MKERKFSSNIKYRCLSVVINILRRFVQQRESLICPLLWFRTDIDECVTSSCSQRCENSAGSYRCLCNPGFSLDSSTGECTGNSATWKIPWCLKQGLQPKRIINNLSGASGPNDFCRSFVAISTTIINLHPFCKITVSPPLLISIELMH